MEGINQKVAENTYVNSLQKPVVKEEKAGDQADFMKLMIAQMQNQNPLDPKDGSEFLSQLAQFSQVEGITKMNDEMSSLSTHLRSSQALQATALVGRQVRVDTHKGLLSEGGDITGMAELPASSSNMNMMVMNAGGTLVKQMDLGTHAGGDVPIRWDGNDQNGQRVGKGVYTIKVNAEQDGEMMELRTELDANVSSVTLGKGGGMTLNIAAVGPVALTDVTQIK